MKVWFWVGRGYYVVNVVDCITNNEYENFEIPVEEKFNAEGFQIIEEIKYLQVVYKKYYWWC